MMKRLILAAILALMVAGAIGVPAMAEDAPPVAWCVDGVTVGRFVSDVTRNVIEVTTTTVCDSPYVGNITYEYETVAVWKSSRRGGYYAEPNGVPAGPYNPRAGGR